MILDELQYIRKYGVPEYERGSIEYNAYWDWQYDLCTKGLTVGGVEITGWMYWFLNYWMIEASSSNRRGKVVRLPDFRDCDWMVMEYFKRCYDERKGMILLTQRGIGKSFWAGSFVGWYYTLFPNSECLLSAGHEDDIVNLCNKIKLGLNSLPVEFQHDRVSDNWKEEVRSGTDEVVNNIKRRIGFNSRILIRNYKNRTDAANGTRPWLHVFEEAGKFHNSLIDCYNSSKECWMEGEVQFGIPLIIGTGGDMEKGAMDFSRMFYSADEFNLLAYDTTYGDESGKFSCFIPAQYGLNGYKNEVSLGSYAKGRKGHDLLDNSIIRVTDFAKADEYLNAEREKKKKAKDSKVYRDELIYRPLMPKEAFLRGTGNIFNILRINEQIARIKNEKIALQRGYLDYNDNRIVVWRPDPRGDIHIFEHPVKDNQSNLYVGGTDPYAVDISTTDSLGSTFIYKRFRSNAGELYNLPVAQYTGRPATQEIYYDTLIKLLEYYGCQTLFENNVGGVFDHFRRKHKIPLLMGRPSWLIKSMIPDSKAKYDFGMHMTKEIKEQLTLDVRDYIEAYVENIFFVDLLHDLSYYDPERNCDRLMSFGLCLFADKQLHNTKMQEAKDKVVGNQFTRFGFVNGNLVRGVVGDNDGSETNIIKYRNNLIRKGI